jgi:hypothetical protein
MAKDVMIDTFGLGIVGAKEQSSQIVYDYVKGMGGRKESTVCLWREISAQMRPLLMGRLPMPTILMIPMTRPSFILA